MRFTISREKLQEGLAAVTAAVPAKTTLTFQEQSAAGCGNQVDSAPRAAEFTLRVAGDLCTLELRETEQEPEF